MFKKGKSVKFVIKKLGRIRFTKNKLKSCYRNDIALLTMLGSVHR